jgi:hypothetical protein
MQAVMKAIGDATKIVMAEKDWPDMDKRDGSPGEADAEEEACMRTGQLQLITRRSTTA